MEALGFFILVDPDMLAYMAVFVQDPVAGWLADVVRYRCVTATTATKFNYDNIYFYEATAAAVTLYCRLAGYIAH